MCGLWLQLDRISLKPGVAFYHALQASKGREMGAPWWDAMALFAGLGPELELRAGAAKDLADLKQGGRRW